MPGTRVRHRRPEHRPIVPDIDVLTAIKKEVVDGRVNPAMTKE
jgi:hypothetical protein